MAKTTSEISPSANAFTFKLEQELPIMASMGDVPDGTWNVETVGSWHDKGQMA